MMRWEDVKKKNPALREVMLYTLPWITMDKKKKPPPKKQIQNGWKIF